MQHTAIRASTTVEALRFVALDLRKPKLAASVLSQCRVLHDPAVWGPAQLDNSIGGNKNMEEHTRSLQNPDREADTNNYMERILRTLGDHSSQGAAAVSPSSGSLPVDHRVAAAADEFPSSSSTTATLYPWSTFDLASSPEPGTPLEPTNSVAMTNVGGSNWRSSISQNTISSSIQREILTEFPWLGEDLHQRQQSRLNPSSSASTAARAMFPASRFSRMLGSTVQGLGVHSAQEEAGFQEGGLIEGFDAHVAAAAADDDDAFGEGSELAEFRSSNIQSPEAFPDIPSTWEHGEDFDEPPQEHHHNQLILPSFPLSDRLQSVVGAISNPATPNSDQSLSSSLSDGETEPKATAAAGHDPSLGSVDSKKRKSPERDETEDAAAKNDEPAAKKPMNRPVRKKGGAKRVREPRYAIKTRTDTDVMDDGYKWRKYGQKAVKNSPHPRNYYRCTTPNCPVRKRVERSCEDPGLVVTTYEGQHTHQTPSSHQQLLHLMRPPPGHLSFFGGAASFGTFFSSHGHNTNYMMNNDNSSSNIVNPSPTLLLPPSSPHENFPISDFSACTTTQILPTSISSLAAGGFSNVKPSLQRWLQEAGPISPQQQQQQQPPNLGAASSSSSGLQEDLTILRERELRRLVNMHRQDHQQDHQHLVKRELLPNFRLVGPGGSGAGAGAAHHHHHEDPGAREQGITATFGANSSMSPTGVMSVMSSQAGVGQSLISNQVLGRSPAQGGGGGGLLYGGITTRSSPFDLHSSAQGAGPMSSEPQSFGTSRTRQAVAEGMGIMMSSQPGDDELVQSFRGGSSQGDTSVSGGQESSAAIDEGLLQDMFKPIIPNTSRS